MFSNQAVLSACLITLLGLVSTRLILRRENNPMVLSFTPTSHVNATAVQTPAPAAYSYIQTWQYLSARV